jgi:hypothetical protein
VLISGLISGKGGTPPWLWLEAPVELIVCYALLAELERGFAAL